MAENYGLISKPVVYDVIFIGEVGSIIANLFFKITGNKFKCLVINNTKSILEPTLLPSHSPYISIDKFCPKNYDVAIENVFLINPSENYVKTESKIHFAYKYLVYAKGTEWANFNYIQNLNEALSTTYSLVYSNLKKPFEHETFCKIQNAVFFVPKGPHGGYDNYNFLYCLQELRSKSQNNNVKALIILEGNKFFPFCEEAETIIRENLGNEEVKIIEDTKLTKIDYIRRVLVTEKKSILHYDFFYCFIPHETPKILKKAEINPFKNCEKTLMNSVHKNIFIVGADLFPTTFSFRAINYQVHTIVQNLQILLVGKDYLVRYTGKTEFPVWTNQNNFLSFSHDYSGKKKQKKACECQWINQMKRKLFFKKQITLYYNLEQEGAPYFLFSPQIEGTIPSEEKVKAIIRRTKQQKKRSIMVPGKQI